MTVLLVGIAILVVPERIHSSCWRAAGGMAAHAVVAATESVSEAENAAGAGADHAGSAEDRLSASEAGSELTPDETVVEGQKESLRNYELDPLLMKACREFADWENRARDEVVCLFEQFMDQHPNSPFLPEIYYRIGTMYSSNFNPDRGETYDREVMAAYFGKARKLYGRAYSNENSSAWSHLVGRRGVPLEAKKGYYDWLTDMMENGGPNDIYPVRSMGAYFEGPLRPELSQREKAVAIENFKKHAPRRISLLEEAIVQRATSADLADLARSYPNRRLGKLAAFRLGQTKAVPDDILELLASRPSNSAQDGVPSTTLRRSSAQPNLATSKPQNGGASGGMPVERAHASEAYAGRVRVGIIGGIVTVALGVLAGLALWRRKQRRGV